MRSPGPAMRTARWSRCWRCCSCRSRSASWRNVPIAAHGRGRAIPVKRVEAARRFQRTRHPQPHDAVARSDARTWSRSTSSSAAIRTADRGEAGGCASGSGAPWTANRRGLAHHQFHRGSALGMSSANHRLCRARGYRQNGQPVRARLHLQRLAAIFEDGNPWRRWIRIRSMSVGRQKLLSGVRTMNLRWRMLASIAMLGCVVWPPMPSPRPGSIMAASRPCARSTSRTRVHRPPGRWSAERWALRRVPVVEQQSRPARPRRRCGRQPVAGAASGTTGFEYTVLVGTRPRPNHDQQAGSGRDCVSIERGQFNNIRLVPESAATHLRRRRRYPRPCTGARAEDVAAEHACDRQAAALTATTDAVRPRPSADAPALR